MSDKKQIDEMAKVLIRLSNVIIALVLLTIVLGVMLVFYLPKRTVEKEIQTPVPDEFGNFTKGAQLKAKEISSSDHFWIAPEVSTLESVPNKDQVLYGKELIVHTSAYFGINGTVLKSSTNGMNCQNCHLDAGTKVFGNNYSAVASTYPKYRPRSGSVENIYKRVNDCFERSLNGKSLDTNSKEMQSIVSYIYWLGKNVEKGKKPEGSGFKDLALLDRAADCEKGRSVYTSKCQSCHQAKGEGLLNSEKTAFTNPPLWGPHSYNDGAGMYRLSTFARFVKCNMPLGASHHATQLSDEDAWDVAAYVNSQSRPKKDISKDWPKIEEKPFDHPFGPYLDGFTERQHKFGPFKPIKAKLDSMKKKVH